MRSIWRTSGGRVLIELLYGTEGITRQNLTVTFDRVQLCRRLNIRRARWDETLGWLSDQGLIYWESGNTAILKEIKSNGKK
jgi:hypothetical protein